MKKIVSIILAFVMLLSVCFACVACDDENDNTGSSGSSGSSAIQYRAAADFFYSDDKGHTYGNGTKEYEVNETVYMKVKAKVTTNNTTAETIKVTLTIPNITALDAKYYDGQPITPTYDAVQNVTTYEFTIVAASDAQEWEFVFQFIPNAAAEVTMKLTFDDKIDALYDKQNTVKFVEAESGE